MSIPFRSLMQPRELTKCQYCLSPLMHANKCQHCGATHIPPSRVGGPWMVKVQDDTPSARYIVAVFALAVGIMGVLLYAVGLI